MFSQTAYIKSCLKAAGSRKWREIAAGSGVPYGTVKRIGTGATPSPRSSTADKLSLYFQTLEKRGR